MSTWRGDGRSIDTRSRQTTEASLFSVSAQTFWISFRTSTNVYRPSSLTFLWPAPSCGIHVETHARGMRTPPVPHFSSLLASQSIRLRYLSDTSYSFPPFVCIHLWRLGEEKPHRRHLTTHHTPWAPTSPGLDTCIDTDRRPSWLDKQSETGS